MIQPGRTEIMKWREKGGKPAKGGSNDEEDADIGVLQNNVCQRDKGGRKVQPLERKEKKRPVGPGMQGREKCGTWEKGETCEWT